MLFFILGFVCTCIIFELFKSLALFASFKKLEAQLLFVASSLVQYKYHAIKIVEIAYSADDEKKEECANIVAKIHEKFDGYGDKWVESLKVNLPYATQYNDWKSAIQYFEQLLIKVKEQDGNDIK